MQKLHISVLAKIHFYWKGTKSTRAKGHFHFHLKMKRESKGQYLYLKHSQSKGPVQITVGLNHRLAVVAFQVDSGDGFGPLVQPVQQPTRHI